MTDEQNLISVALDQRSSETEQVTSGPILRLGREEVVVVDWSLSSSMALVLVS